MAIDYTKMVSQYQKQKEEQDRRKALQNISYTTPQEEGGGISGFFGNLARGAVKTSLRAYGTAHTAVSAAGQVLTGRGEQAAETVKYGSRATRRAEKELGYEEGEISKPYKIGVNIEEQKKRGMFGKETLETFGAGAELASYGMGAPAAKGTWQAAKTAGVPLGKLAWGTAKREAVAGAVGSMGNKVQEEDATAGGVIGAGLMGYGIGAVGGFALPYASKAFSGMKTWNKSANEAVEQSLKQAKSKTPVTHWSQATPQTEIPKINQPLSEIDDDLFPPISEAAKPVSDSLKKKASNLGFKDWQVNLISEMSPSECSSVNKMVSMAEDKSQNMLARSPVDEAAKPIIEQIGHLQNVKRTSGAALDDLVDEMPGDAISLANPTAQARNWLENVGVRIKQNKKGQFALNFTSSKFSTSASAKDRRVISEAFQELYPSRAKGLESFKTPKEIRMSRQRIRKILDSQLKTAEPFSSETERFLSSIRTELQKPLSELSPKYAEASRGYAISTEKLRSFYKFLGKDFFDASAEDISKRIDEVLPRLVSNTSAKPGAILRELSDGALATGMKEQPVQDPRRLIYISEMLNDMYDINSPKGFQGSLERSGENVLGKAADVAGGVADLATLKPISAAQRAMKYLGSDVKLKRQQTLKQIIEEALRGIKEEVAEEATAKAAARTAKKTAKKPRPEAAGAMAGIEPEFDEEGKPTGKIGFDLKKALMGMMGMTAAKRLAPKFISPKAAAKDVTPEIADTMTRIIDYVRLKGKKNLELEADATRLVKDFGLKPNKDPNKLADQFDAILQESNINKKTAQ